MGIGPIAKIGVVKERSVQNLVNKEVLMRESGYENKCKRRMPTMVRGYET